MACNHNVPCNVQLQLELSQQLLCTELSEVERMIAHKEHVWRAATAATQLLLQDEREKWHLESKNAIASLGRQQTANSGFKKLGQRSSLRWIFDQTAATDTGGS